MEVTNRRNHDNIVKLNVGGMPFWTRLTTLERFKNSNLLTFIEHELAESPDDIIFLDRDPDYFKPILELCRTGELHAPPSLCWFRLRKELEFWEIDPHYYITSCCAQHVMQIEEKEQVGLYIIKQLTQIADVNHHTENTHTVVWRNTACKYFHEIWMFLEYPMSSKPAMVWGVLFLLVVLFAVFLEVTASLPSCRVPRIEPLWNISQETNPKKILAATTDHSPILAELEIACFSMFVTELILRFIVCPSKLEFIKSIYTLIDIVCILPGFILLLIGTALKDDHSRILVHVNLSLNAFSVFRVLRLFKYLRHSLSFRVLFLALRASLKEIGLLIMLLFLGMMFFAMLIFFTELESTDQFANIAVGFWWAIVTMTTVGYGDYYPQTVGGCIVGSLCAIFGMVLIGIPIPAISNNFNQIYNTARCQLVSDKWHEDRAKRKKVKKSLLRFGVLTPHKIMVQHGMNSTSKSDKKNQDGEVTL